jgi:hypothetical protein
MTVEAIERSIPISSTAQIVSRSIWRLPYLSPVSYDTQLSGSYLSNYYLPGLGGPYGTRYYLPTGRYLRLEKRVSGTGPTGSSDTNNGRHDAARKVRVHRVQHSVQHQP